MSGSVKQLSERARRSLPSVPSTLSASLSLYNRSSSTSHSIKRHLTAIQFHQKIDRQNKMNTNHNEIRYAKRRASSRDAPSSTPRTWSFAEVGPHTGAARRAGLPSAGAERVRSSHPRRSVCAHTHCSVLLPGALSPARARQVEQDFGVLFAAA